MARFDKSAILSRVDGDTELLREVAETFEREAIVMMDRIRSAIQKKDASALRAAAHSMKGAVSIFDTESCYAAAYALELAAKNSEWSQVDGLFRELECKINVLSSFIVDLRQGNI